MWELALEMANGDQQYALQILEVALANLNKLDEHVIESNAGTFDEGKHMTESNAGALTDGTENSNSSSADICHGRTIVCTADEDVAINATLEVGCRVAIKGFPGYVRFVSGFPLPFHTSCSSEGSD